MLGCNDIGDDGISDVVRGLISKQALVYLDLSSNSIKAEGILSVANVIQHLKNLEYLNLSNLIGSSASSLVLMNRTYSVGFVEGLMKNPNIYHLQINNFDLDETALNYLIDKLENMNNLAVLACGSLTVDCERRIKRAKDLIIYKQKVNRHENKIEMILI